jgi:hypothetical protein
MGDGLQEQLGLKLETGPGLVQIIVIDHAEDGRRLEPLDDEQRVLDLIRCLHGDGRSLRAIASELNEKGSRTRSGAPFEYVRNVLRVPEGSVRLEATSCLA